MSCGGGSVSGRAHFRSNFGCCICGTKSSSSRFIISTRFSQHFVPCFGADVANRSGDLCNACVLCVKRWLKRHQKHGQFSQVVDSKRGPGPKHMKEIAKRARRREAKTAITPNKITRSSTLSSTQSNNINPVTNLTCCQLTKASTTTPSTVSSNSCCVACWTASSDSISGVSETNSNPQSTNLRSSLLIHTEGATLTRAAARQLEAANSIEAGLCAKCLVPANASTPNKHSKLLSHSNSSQCLSKSTRHCTCASCNYYQAGAFDLKDSHNSWEPMINGLNSEIPPEFRHPPPPLTNLVTRACNYTKHNSSLVNFSREQFMCSSPCRNLFSCCNDACSNASSTPPSTPKRYNRRVQLKPIKMADGEVVDALLREIMQSNSQAINFDSRQMHMAVQRELRLRSRTVNASTSGVSCSGSTSLSGQRSSSLEYASEFSSIDNASVDSHNQYGNESSDTLFIPQRSLRRS